MQDDKFEDITYKKMVRDFGKDDFVKVLLSKIREKDIELGKLKSEILYLENITIKKAKVKIRKDKLYKDLKLSKLKVQNDLKKSKINNNKLHSIINKLRESSNKT